MAYRPVKAKDARTVQPFDSTIIVSLPSKSNHRYFHAFDRWKPSQAGSGSWRFKWKASQPCLPGRN